jgi:hypothetical protein
MNPPTRESRPPVVSMPQLAAKVLILFVAANLVFAAWTPSGLGRLSLYNRLFPGRERLPFGESPQASYNLSLEDLEAMFASHRISSEQSRPDEYRILVLGDSSVWGALLRPEQTLAAKLADLVPIVCGKRTRVYNLGYPTLSLTKDLLILDRAMRYQPDLVLWPTTLEAFVRENQLASPVVVGNPVYAREVLVRAGLSSPGVGLPTRPSFWAQTFIGRRRALADLIRLQLYGVMWAATGIDQAYPEIYPAAQTDFEADSSFHHESAPPLDETHLAFEVLDAAVRVAGHVPVLVVNEPILISPGTNSQLRYNFYYPRWAFDQFRGLLQQRALASDWEYLDLWNLVPANDFTNTAIHLTPRGESMLAQSLAQSILARGCR